MGWDQTFISLHSISTRIFSVGNIPGPCPSISRQITPESQFGGVLLIWPNLSRGQEYPTSIPAVDRALGTPLCVRFGSAGDFLTKYRIVFVFWRLILHGLFISFLLSRHQRHHRVSIHIDRQLLQVSVYILLRTACSSCGQRLLCTTCMYILSGCSSYHCPCSCPLHHHSAPVPCPAKD